MFVETEELFLPSLSLLLLPSILFLRLSLDYDCRAINFSGEGNKLVNPRFSRWLTFHRSISALSALLPFSKLSNDGTFNLPDPEQRKDLIAPPHGSLKSFPFLSPRSFNRDSRSITRTIQFHRLIRFGL